MQSPHPVMSLPFEQWLPTGAAALALGCSADTLKRYAKRDEFLVEGTHWRRGPYHQSPKIWNFPACQQAIQYRGRLRSRRASA